VGLGRLTSPLTSLRRSDPSFLRKSLRDFGRPGGRPSWRVRVWAVVGYSGKGWIRITPPANKLSGEDPDGAPAFTRLPRNDSLPRNDVGLGEVGGCSAVVDARSSLDSSGACCFKQERSVGPWQTGTSAAPVSVSAAAVIWQTGTSAAPIRRGDQLPALSSSSSQRWSLS